MLSSFKSIAITEHETYITLEFNGEEYDLELSTPLSSPSSSKITFSSFAQVSITDNVLSIGDKSYELVISEPTPTVDYHVTFSSPNSFTLNVVDNIKYWDGTLEYSTDLSIWTVWDGTTTLTARSDGTKYNLYMRGVNNTKITGSNASTTKGHWVLTGSNISCNGNIENLLDYEEVILGNHPTMADYCYRSMFSGCTSLIMAPELLAVTLTSYCYYHMFYGCTSLTTAPTLPATTLANSCYSSMFYNCTSLTTVPELPIMTLENSCYSWMFAYCTALTVAPALPATTLTSYCYSCMFYNCTSLITAPELPATTLASYCYEGMFYNCGALTVAPELPATTLANNCYQAMFDTCVSLTTIPELPATTLANYCYANMFIRCYALTTIPELPATTLASYCYEYMFYNCTNIKLSTTQTGRYTKAYRIPTTGTGTAATSSLSNMFTKTSGTFKGTPTINTTYYLYVS